MTANNDGGYHGAERRQSRDENLDELIARANDPLMKAALLWMGKVSRHVDAQTDAVVALKDAVERIDADSTRQRNEDSSRVSFAKGVAWSGGVLIGALFAVITYILGAHIAADADDARQIRINTERLRVIEYQIGELQRARDNTR